MSKSISKLRLILIILFVIDWIIFCVEVIPDLKIQYIPVLLYFFASILLIINKKWADLISLIIFTVFLVSLFSAGIQYCSEQNLNSVFVCSGKVFTILLNQKWSEIFFNILTVTSVLYLSTVLSKNLFNDKKLNLK